jgi:polyisoprenoid-binding protein YceI
MISTSLRAGVHALAFGSFVLAGGSAQAERWTVDRERSSLDFEIVETGNRVSGRFARWDAEIGYDASDLAAARVRVSVGTASGATGERRRDEMMIGPDWLDSARVPEAVFEAQGFRALADGRFETTGTLRLRDGVRPVALVFTLAVAGDEARARGRATLIRTQFGVGQGQWGGLTIVGLEVTVAFDLVARRR